MITPTKMQETKLHALFRSCSCTTRQGSTPYSEDRYCVSQQRREKPLPLYYGLKLHALGRQKNQIGIAQEQLICVSYRRVMEVKLDIAQAVCARDAEDGVVVPTNSRMSVFTTT